jgi:hypothetical protein
MVHESGGATVPKPEPLYVRWRGRMVRVRHGDLTLRSYTPNADRLMSAMQLASDVAGLRLVLATTIADRCEVQLPGDGAEVRLRRRT